MKAHYAATVCEGERVETVFAMPVKEMRSARTGEAYLSLEFADASGRIGGIMFRPGRNAMSVPEGSVVHVRGTVTSYRGVRRVSVESLGPATGFDVRDVLPAGTRDPDELVAELRALFRGIRDRRLAAVVRGVYGDRTFMERFRQSPGDPEGHHAYIGGLLEHTVTVASACRSLAALYTHADADLLLTGALLHDVGTVDTLVLEHGFGYTDEGRMLGHSVLGERRARGAARSSSGGLPEGTMLQLSHLILSHHGGPDSGGAVEPCTLEAGLLRHVVALDAAAGAHVEATAPAARAGERWAIGHGRPGRALHVPGASSAEQAGDVVTLRA